MIKRFDPHVIDTLKLLKFQGNKATMPQLDRKLYEQVNKVLELAGGKWSRKDKAHLFPDDAEDTIADVILTGQIIDRKKAFQYFPTPDALADRMVQLANVAGAGCSFILEPSAGDGSLVRAIRRRDRHVHITAVELDERHHDSLVQSGANIVRIGDFLEQNFELASFNRIIANPPFRNLQDIAHLRRMFDLLAPGGTLVCVTSPSWTFRTTHAAEDFRAWLEEQPATIEELPEGTFSSSGTEIRTQLITLTRSGKPTHLVLDATESPTSHPDLFAPAPEENPELISETIEANAFDGRLPTEVRFSMDEPFVDFFAKWDDLMESKETLAAKHQARIDELIPLLAATPKQGTANRKIRKELTEEIEEHKAVPLAFHAACEELYLQAQAQIEEQFTALAHAAGLTDPDALANACEDWNNTISERRSAEHWCSSTSGTSITLGAVARRIIDDHLDDEQPAPTPVQTPAPSPSRQPPVAIPSWRDLIRTKAA